jgi:dipeptidyl aminopeptidase/acylaminoacyl peptidase
MSPAPLGAQSAAPAVTRPVISEDVAPLEAIAPIAKDGHRGVALLRKPPGAGPFPAVVVIHGGLAQVPAERLRNVALAPQPSRYLAAGYVVAAITYRSRNVDPQSRVSVLDSLAVVDHVLALPYVDPKSVVVSGCSGGGDLALEVAALTASVAAIASEEPASVLMSGVLNKDTPKSGDLYTPGDAQPLLRDPQRYYATPHQELLREKISRIRTPILIQQGDETSALNRFNAHVLLPELRRAGKSLEVITYPGEPHCFAFFGDNRPIAALKAFQDADAFFRRHLATKPKPIEPSLVK